ncbi:unnamed protein product, partial [Brenthis ino]
MCSIRSRHRPARWGGSASARCLRNEKNFHVSKLSHVLNAKWLIAGCTDGVRGQRQHVPALLVCHTRVDVFDNSSLISVESIN